MLKRKYVISDGALYSLTPRRWWFWLRDRSEGLHPNASDFGKLVANNVVTVTDMSPEEARDRFLNLDPNKKEA